MKTVLDWLNEAQHQGYDWVDAAISNYIREWAGSPYKGEFYSLREALVKAFDWTKSPEGNDFWYGVFESIRAAEKGEPATTPLHELSLLYEDISERLINLDPDPSLREPYRTASLEAYKASYEAELTELKEKIAEELGMGNLSGLSSELEEAHEQIGRLKREYDAITDTERNLRKEISTLRKDLERQVSHTQSIEKELEVAKGRKLIGWVIQDKSGEYFRYVISNPVKIGDAWKGCSTVLGEYLTLNEITKAGYPVPSWSDEEPIRIYE